MYIHIAIFKWRTGTEAETIMRALQEVAALESKIPGVIEIAWGENESQFSEGYSHVVIVRGKDKDAIQAYRAHPDHEAVAARIEGIEEHGIGVDFSPCK